MDLKRTTYKNLYRDTESGAILNTDRSGLEAYKKRKQQAREFVNMKERQETMEKDMHEIKTLLHDVLEKLDK